MLIKLHWIGNNPLCYATRIKTREKMANSQKLQNTLQKELNELKNLADEQMHAYQSARTLLYKGLAMVYLWWAKANKEKGLLEKIYKQNNIQYKKDIKANENFSPLLQYLWGMDGTVNSNTIDLWNRTLNKVHTTVVSDTYYKTNTVNKIISFISDKGGVRGLAGYDSLPTVDVAKAVEVKKPKLSVDVEKKRHVEHLEKSKMYFAQTAKPLSKFETKHSLPTADSSIGLGLFRKTKNGYELLKAVDDKNLIEQALVGAYARSTDSVPYTVSLLTEMIATQTVPKALESISRSLADKSKAKTDDGKVMDSLKRLLFMSKEGVFLLSANRSDCSVVTIATPKRKIMSSKHDVAMSVNDSTWIESNVIHSGDINFFTTDSPNKMQVASSKEHPTHKVRFENSLTKRFRFIRFYPLTMFSEGINRQQAIQALAIKAVHKAKLDANWLAELNGEFLSRWVNGLGKRMKRQEHSVIAMSFGKKGVTFKWIQRADTYEDEQLIKYTYPNKTKALTVEVLSKDIIPILNSLVYGDIKGSVDVAVDSKAIQFKYETLNATYQIALPTLNSKGKRNGDYFASYGG